jgi:hypothetical protein
MINSETIGETMETKRAWIKAALVTALMTLASTVCSASAVWGQ